MKMQNIESRCYRTGKYTVCRRFRAFFSREILQAVAVKGLSATSQDSSHVEIADETASMSNEKKKSKQKGAVNTQASPSILLHVSVTGQEFVLAAAVDKKEG